MKKEEMIALTASVLMAGALSGNTPHKKRQDYVLEAINLYKETLKQLKEE